MKRVSHEREGVHRGAYALVSYKDGDIRFQTNNIPTISSRKKNTVSIAKRMSILVDFERPMVGRNGARAKVENAVNWREVRGSYRKLLALGKASVRTLRIQKHVRCPKKFKENGK